MTTWVYRRRIRAKNLRNNRRLDFDSIYQNQPAFVFTGDAFAKILCPEMEKHLYFGYGRRHLFGPDFVRRRVFRILFRNFAFGKIDFLRPVCRGAAARCADGGNFEKEACA